MGPAVPSPVAAATGLRAGGASQGVWQEAEPELQLQHILDTPSCVAQAAEVDPAAAGSATAAAGIMAQATGQEGWQQAEPRLQLQPAVAAPHTQGDAPSLQPPAAVAGSTDAAAVQLQGPPPVAPIALQAGPHGHSKMTLGRQELYLPAPQVHPTSPPLPNSCTCTRSHSILQEPPLQPLGICLGVVFSFSSRACP